MQTLKRLGNNIRKIRELRNYDQRYMAESLGISQSQYSRIEKAGTDLRISTLEEIAQILGVSRHVIETFNADVILEGLEPGSEQKTTSDMVVYIDRDQVNVYPVPVISYCVNWFIDQSHASYLKYHFSATKALPPATQ